MGFNATIIGPFSATTEVLAPSVAAFNQVSYFVVHSDLLTKGIRTNDSYAQTLGQVLIDVAPGSQILSRPFNPARIEAQELAGTKRSTLRFWLTDQSNRLVDTNSEYWSARIVIRYLMPL